MTGADLRALLGDVRTLRRTPSPWASSAPLEDVHVVTGDGRTVALVLKQAPQAEVAAYRDLLPGSGAPTPACLAAGDDWLLLERVDGDPLWASGDDDAWTRAAHALRATHRALADRGRDLPAWRGADVVPTELAAPHARAAAMLGAAPQAVVHGEAFAANVVDDGARAVLVDWATASRGCALLDLAMLAAGWDDPGTQRLAQAYGADPSLLAAARLVVAVRWLGAPPAHERAAGGTAARTDWAALAAAAAEELS